MLDIKYSDNATKQLSQISKGDKSNAKLILKSLEKFAEFPLEKQDVKILKGKFGFLKRLRAGNYRIIFENDNQCIYVYEIKHRKDVHRD
ncbi:MAG: type II toxin-antitoxin system RelE/ParE family toxin [Bacteroidetes bacterium]|nr:MAG: type II toxin-antitoxin system RelE/ParE family toxin [Bacteroidota bacterium]